MSGKVLSELILELLHAHHLLSAQEMLRRLRDGHQTYNKTSVYRALDQLTESQAVCRHFFQDGEAYYELREHHHAHLVCTRCKQVSSADCAYQEPRIVGRFQPDHHHVTIYGLCERCA